MIKNGLYLKPEVTTDYQYICKVEGSALYIKRYFMYMQKTGGTYRGNYLIISNQGDDHVHVYAYTF